MKRPFAVIGFSMLVVSLLVINISFYTSVALLIGATVVFLAFLAFEKLRKKLTMIFSAFAVMLYIVSFIFTQSIYVDAAKRFENQVNISGVVCQTPQETDYAFTYIIKLSDANYKIRYVAKEDKMFREGDIVSGTVIKSDEEFQEDFFENSLSSKVYFTFFDGEKSILHKTGETDKFYKNIGKMKNWFTNVIDMYLPGENGAIAKAMTIGDKSKISSGTIDHFNYAGTSHLLVISGLHLTLWSVGLVRFTEKFIFLRKRMVVVGALCLFGYCALTGFSVSVIRAGIMVGTMLLGKFLSRGSDSINSIGLALVLILTVNPYAVLSASLWFTVLSTLGILVISQNVIMKINSTDKGKKIMKKWLVSLLVTTITISISTTIFTLPIFIVKIGMLPVAAFIANLIMVDLALVLMVLTMIGVFLHGVGLTVFADFSFIAIGTIGNFLKFVAEKIGLAKWSTISLSHKYFLNFLVFALACIFIAFIFKRHKDKLTKALAASLSMAFILLTIYCTSYDYNNPSVDIVFTQTTPTLLVNVNGESVLINPPSASYDSEVKAKLNSHNEKSIDAIFITENGTHMPSYLINCYSRFGVTNTLFCYNSPELFQNQSQGNVKALTIGGKVRINTENYMEYYTITYKSNNLIVIDGKNAQNLFEKVKDYDIIILYGDNALDVKKSIEKQKPNALVLVSQEAQTCSVYFN